MKKLKLAIVRLSGFTGYYLSCLDLDEWLFDFAAQVDLVYSSFADIKEYPEEVDIVLVEGAIASEDHLELIKKVRDRSKVLISFGDCAVTDNITALGNPLRAIKSMLKRCYFKTATLQNQIPDESEIVSTLWEQLLPVPEVVEVDVYLPGYPPNPNHVQAALATLLMGEIPHLMG